VSANRRSRLFTRRSFTSREHVIALEPRGKGLLGVTLRYPYEVRKEDEYFDDIPDEKIPKDMLELASHIVETKAGHFEPEKFEDQYEDALKELLKKKQAGEKIEAPKERAPAKVINLMDALRRSVEAERGGSTKRQASPRCEHMTLRAEPSRPCHGIDAAEIDGPVWSVSDPGTGGAFRSSRTDGGPQVLPPARATPRIGVQFRSQSTMSVCAPDRRSIS
jgi:hypothetical protein